MPPRVHLWIATMEVSVKYAEALSEFFADKALSLSVLAPPRKATAMVEAIFDHEPSTVDIHLKIALFSTLHHTHVDRLQIKPAPNLDWLKKVAEDFPPLKIGRWTVHGAMHRDKVPQRLLALQIDATNAFGTGEHPTTRGCLLMLDYLLKGGLHVQRMADIGCGSGILAMGCVQATRGMAVAVDLDPDAVEIAARNIRINGLGNKIRTRRSRGYISSLVRRHAPYDLIMANIFAHPLSHMAKDLKSHLRPGGFAILSGLLTTQANLVIAAHRLQGLALVRHTKRGEWSVLALTRPHRA